MLAAMFCLPDAVADPFSPSSPLPLPSLSHPQDGWVVNLTGDVFLDWLDSSKWTEEMWKLIGLSHQQAVVECVHISHWTYQVLIGNEHRWHWVESNLVRPAGPLFPPGAIRFFCVCHFMMVDGQLQVF